MPLLNPLKPPSSKPIHDLNEQRQIFRAAYENLTTPLCLCKGFEIVVCNTAFEQMIATTLSSKRHSTTPNRTLNGLLLNALFNGLDRQDHIFTAAGGSGEIREENHIFSVHGKPWSVAPQLTLLECRNDTDHYIVLEKMRAAQTHDPQIGVLLPTAFWHRAEANFNIYDSGCVALIRMAQTGIGLSQLPIAHHYSNSESRIDKLKSLADQLRHDLGQNVLLGLGPCHNSTIIFMPFTKGTETKKEGKHSFRQICQIVKRCTISPQPHVAIALFPDHGKNQLELTEAIEIASCKSIINGKPTAYEAEFKTEQDKLKALADDFSQALKDGQIAPHFQPVIQAATGQILGFEALVRWVHPEHGYVIPPHIIDIARQSNLLNVLTHTVIQHCVEEMKGWPERISFAINVLPEQMTGELVDIVRETVRSTRIDPARLEIEITEDALIEDFARSCQIIARLRAIGVSVAMDDFGAGFTSLSNLRRLPVTKIKIDKSIANGLPDDPRTCAIVRSIFVMGQELNVAVTVEGIEEEAQALFLKDYDCGIQGFFYSRPLPRKDLGELARFLTPQERLINTSQKAISG